MEVMDPDFPDPSGEAKWIADSLHGEVVMVPDAGHYPQSQQPEATGEAIVRFLASVDRAAQSRGRCASRSADTSVRRSSQ